MLYTTLKRVVLFATLLCFQFIARCQDQPAADSLIREFESGEYDDPTNMELLRGISLNTSSPDQSIFYASQLLEIARVNGDSRFVHSALTNLGTANSLKGNLNTALEFLFEASSIAEKLGNYRLMGESYAEISTAYSRNNDLRSSLNYNLKAIDAFEKAGDVRYQAFVLLNSGYDFYTLGILDTALDLTSKAERILDSIDHVRVLSYAIGNKGLILAKYGMLDSAEASINIAIDRLTEYDDNYAISDYLYQLGLIYQERNDLPTALEYAQKGYELASRYDFREQVKNASLLLFELYRETGELDKAIDYHLLHIAARDTLQNLETTQRIANQRTEYEVGLKQAEVDLLTAQQQTQRILSLSLAAVVILVITVASIIYRNYKEKHRINQILKDQKAQLERLNSTKDRFFSIISHDLRGPVAAFHGVSRMIEMAVNSEQTDSLLEIAEEIDKSTDRLSALLDNLLNWALQQQGHVPNVPEKLNLKSIGDNLISVFGNMTKSKQLSVQTEIPPDIELWADKNSTETILRNLVGNALKFTPPGGQITLSATVRGDVAQIRVADTGLGIPANQLSRLFELQDKKSTYGTSGEKGLGLGLQLVHEFVRMNKGSIQVESEEGEGTIFTIELPVYSPTAVSQPAYT